MTDLETRFNEQPLTNAARAILATLPQNEALLGAYHGRAIARYLAGKGWQPLHITSATRVDNVVTVHFAGGDGPIVFHRERGHKDRIFGVRAMENNGFSWTQLGGKAPHIKRLRITGPREVTLVLSRAPKRARAEYLWLGLGQTAGPIEGFIKGRPETGTGLATTLRTQSADRDFFGNPLHDWALLQRVRVQKASVVLVPLE